MRGVLTEAYLNEMNDAREELEEVMSNDKSCAPIVMLRLAYASQFAIITKAHDHPSQPKAENKKLPLAYNHDLIKPIETCGKIKGKHPKITYPDLYQLAGVVAVQNLGGPTIGFIPGRKTSSISPDERCVPYVGKGPSELRDLFKPMGFDDKDIVALCGGLKLARVHLERSVLKGSPQAHRTEEEPLKFDNSYFNELKKISSKKIGIAPVQDKKRGLIDNNSSNEIDQALVNDEKFLNYVKLYAKKPEVFFADYKKSHKNLSEFKPHSWIEPALHIPLAQKAVGVAVAVAVAISNFIYLFKRRRTSKHASTQPQ